MSRRCKNCAYFVEIEKDGYCYRYPPRVVNVNREIVSEYPVVDKNEDWCGEFKEITYIEVEAT